MFYVIKYRFAQLLFGTKKKPGRKAPAVSLDPPGSSSRASGWITYEGSLPFRDRVAEVPALPGCLLCRPGSHHPSLAKMTIHGLVHRSRFPGYITPPNGTLPGGLSRSSRDRLFRNTYCASF